MSADTSVVPFGIKSVGIYYD
ncbi:unnamed protein product [Leptidea sinapis]|uniref:Uncharacterized protein n=1 Tax=Leptidea sinapis TaxID=189913 RepID=A0A5E4QS86_9NEOP|nr:unnamed protein product [Leptidea sinapis]